MKIKLLIAFLIAILNMNFQCSNDEHTEPTPTGCECRKMYYEQQVNNGTIEFVYTHRDNWQFIDCEIKANSTLMPNGFYWSTFYVVDELHRYRWECKNE